MVYLLAFFNRKVKSDSRIFFICFKPRRLTVKMYFQKNLPRIIHINAGVLCVAQQLIAENKLARFHTSSVFSLGVRLKLEAFITNDLRLRPSIKSRDSFSRLLGIALGSASFRIFEF